MQVFQNHANNIQFNASRAVNYRTAVVYMNLTDEEALQIGHSHNDMTEGQTYLQSLKMASLWREIYY